MKILMETELKMPEIKVYSNVTARDMMEDYREDKGADVKAYIAELMARQARSPVYWQEVIENMIADGVEAIIEIGPGKTLSGLTKNRSQYF